VIRQQLVVIVKKSNPLLFGGKKARIRRMRTSQAFDAGRWKHQPGPNFR
jgi:hypothetical protein